MFLAFAVTVGAGSSPGGGGSTWIDGTGGDSDSGKDLSPNSLTIDEQSGEAISLSDPSLENSLQLDPAIDIASSVKISPFISMASATTRIAPFSSFPVGPGGAVTPAFGEFSQSGGPSGKKGGVAGSGTGPTDGVGNQGSGDSASFFGATALGKKFVFVIDTSTSVRGKRWKALCEELERALHSLAADQEFFILGFDSEPHPMFGKFPPRGKYLRSNNTTLKRVKNWLGNFELGRRTYPAQAIKIAIFLQPDAIFLLSDGEIMDNTVSELRLLNYAQSSKYISRTIPIHTILLHSQSGYSALETIASENDGTFTPVDIETDTETP